MRVMHSHIRCKPSEKRWQLEVRTAVKRCLVKGPLIFAGPMRALELMLYVEKANSDRGSNKDDGQVDGQIGYHSDLTNKRKSYQPDHRVCPHGAHPIGGARSHQADRKPVA